MHETNAYPAGTAAAVLLDRLYKAARQPLLSERLSSRLVRGAAGLPEGGWAGWQLLAPRGGQARVALFGSEAVDRSDLVWIAEKAGKPGGNAGRLPLPAADRLWELRLPAAEEAAEAAIGFGGSVETRKDLPSAWPARFPDQFEELLRALQDAGAALRAVVGPAGAEAAARCRKLFLRTSPLRGRELEEYLGAPVRARVLLRLPAPPSLRLRTVLGEAVPEARLRELGRMEDPETAGIWEAPLAGAPVLPDCAARILLLEPVLHREVTGVRLCDEEARRLPAVHDGPGDRDAVVLGRATGITGTKRRISIGTGDLQRHCQIVGQTGTGKSTLLATVILSAMARGHGLTFFDPHGSTVDTVLRSVPEALADRIRVVRIGDAEHPVPLSLWDSGDPKREERNVSDLCELFGDIFDPKREGIVGPRYERWLSTFAAASIAIYGRRASLESITVLSRNKDNMLKAYRILEKDWPELAETIKQEYGLDKSSDFNNILNWYLCKFQRLTGVEQLRRTLGAGTNALDFGKSIDTDTVTLIDLASPVIGTHAARVVGTLLMMKLWNAALTRKDREKTHLVVLDEAALFQTNPMPRMLAEGRKFGLSMVLCHQHLGQLSAEVRDALEANAASFCAFRLSPRDAAHAALRFDDPELQALLPRLDAFTAVATLSVRGQQTPPFTLEVSRPKKQKKGEETAARIEAASVDALVKPYEALRALTAAELQDLLDHPEKLKEPEPEWLKEWRARREELKQAG